MEEKKFQPYVPADKVVPEFTVFSVVLGALLAIVFGGANAYLGLRVGMTVSAYPGGGALDGRHPLHLQAGLHSGEQHGPDHRLGR